MKIPIQYRVGIIACFVLLGVVAYFTISTWVNPPIGKETLERIVEIRKDTTRHYEDAQGTVHAETRVATGNPVMLQAVYPFMDSVLHKLDITQKQVQALVAMSTTTTGSVRPHVENVTKGDKTFQRFTYSDRWLDLEGILSDTPLIKYATRDSFLITTYNKQKWWLGKKETFIDAYSLNPASQPNNLTGLRVNIERPRRFGVGPYLGYGFDGEQWRPSVGLSLQYSLIRF